MRGEKRGVERGRGGRAGRGEERREKKKSEEKRERMGETNRKKKHVSTCYLHVHKQASVFL